MKHILRKLHIGGSHDSFDGRNQVLNSPDAVAHPDPAVASTSSGFSGWLTNARHGRRPSPSVAPPRRRLETSDHASTATLTIESPPSSGAQNSLSFNYYEEEYQVQLALALSVSNQNLVDDPESLQIRAAKRISLGRPPSPGNSPGESTSHRYWTYNVLDFSEKVVDGFYDVYGVTTEFGNVEKMPSLVDLQSTPLTDTLGYEVVLVNRAIDQDLVNLEQAALCLSVDCGMSGVSAQSSDLVQKIADLVVQHMGGPVTDANDMFRRWIARSYELRTSLNNIVLPLGCLNIGLSRHRALLFKVLADHVGIPCRLVKGSHYTGTDEGAVNIVKLESEREYIVDLMGAPGTLLPAENATASVDFLDNTSLVEDLLSQIDRAQNVIISESNSRENKKMNNQNTGELGTQINGLSRQKEKECNISNQEQIYNHEHSKNAHEWNSRAPLSQCQPFPHISAQSLNASCSNLCGTSAVPNPCSQSDGPGRAIVPFVNLPKLSSGGFPVESQENSTKVDSVGSINAASKCMLTEDENEARRLNIHQRLNSGYMECWTKHVNNKRDPVLENVSEWEIQWEEIEIGERIGLGSYGEVHHGYWHGKEVAVKKFLDQDFFGDALDEFISEVRIMRRMQHPNVVLFLGAVTRPPSLSIVTEYLPRGSLFRLLHRPNCQLDERLRLKMAIDVAEGMNYLHTSNPIIVHRDLKSPNLLVDKNWVVKVCDFGLSRMKHHTFLSSKSTAGTPEWMAPEVLRNEPSNEKCDVYSFGVILWELCTLQQPWHGMNPMQVVGAVGFQDRRLEIPNNVDPAIARVISGCWQRDPKLRPSFAELTEALKPLQRLLKD